MKHEKSAAALRTLLPNSENMCDKSDESDKIDCRLFRSRSVILINYTRQSGTVKMKMRERRNLNAESICFFLSGINSESPVACGLPE